MKIYILDRKRSTTRYAELYFYGLDNVEVLTQIDEKDFYANLPQLRQDVAVDLGLCDHFLQGQGACHVLSIRPQGGVEMAVPS